MKTYLSQFIAHIVQSILLLMFIQVQYYETRRLAPTAAEKPPNIRIIIGAIVWFTFPAIILEKVPVNNRNVVATIKPATYANPLTCIGISVP